ncbi:mannitol dehydrogenase family protein [Roseicyclus marinus]|uniref:mannitol dehydrogenase family protein n=1 Tax=Roseicyclus marinus TaxID=2161673 RepID=UPI0024106839|nr:mannitol dehydrogenase family protein [Roseicyclus marinus]MDG3041788.1 mannitol dehydrogenase family protein [Roseicyclus marinus]
MSRLTAKAPLPPAIAPGYHPEDHGTGIVHLGLGAFHKAHQAAYTDHALAASGGDWRIIGISLRSPDPARQLMPQDGRYTLIERDAGGSRARVIGSIARALCAADDPGAALAALTGPACRIVTLTVTEKAYGLDRAGGGLDPDHPAVRPDLARPEAPTGVLGLLTRALALRVDAGLPPFTTLCCDNLPRNGALLRDAVLDFARRAYPALADRIEATAAFPSTMVDRITPAPTEATRAEAARLIGYDDHAATETEAFHQWVIEDDFPLGRPDWDRAGALFVSDVAPYETMKLRMLNGSHSMLAYAGFHAGLPLVRDVMAHAGLAALVRRHMAAAAATLPALPGIDLSAYAEQLRVRFANPAIAHETFQIAMDGTQKLPQRIFAPALDTLSAGGDLRPFAFATAAWMRHATVTDRDCAPYDLRDPMADEIAKTLKDVGTAEDIVRTLSALPGFMPAALRDAPGWQTMISGRLRIMLTDGMAKAIAQEAAT